MTTNDSGSAPKPPAKDPWDLPDVSGLTVGVLGGTGDQGRGLAYRLARAGPEGDHRLARRRARRGRPPTNWASASRARTTPSARAAATS